MDNVVFSYGQPGQVSNVYNQFAEFYLKEFAGPSIQTMLKVLQNYRNKTYVAPRVIHNALGYIESG